MIFLRWVVEPPTSLGVYLVLSRTSKPIPQKRMLHPSFTLRIFHKRTEWAQTLDHAQRVLNPGGHLRWKSNLGWFSPPSSELPLIKRLSDPLPVSTPSESHCVGEQNSGKTLACSLEEWQETMWLQTWSATMRQSVHVRREVNGSKHWPCSEKCVSEWLVQLWLATMRQSVLVRREVNGSRHCFGFKRCPRQKFDWTSSATVRLSVHVRRVVNASSQRLCLKGCCQPQCSNWEFFSGSLWAALLEASWTMDQSNRLKKSKSSEDLHAETAGLIQGWLVPCPQALYIQSWGHGHGCENWMMIDLAKRLLNAFFGHWPNGFLGVLSFHES